MLCFWTVGTVWFPASGEKILPVHASYGQVNVWILEEHAREEVLLGRMDQIRRIYDLQHRHTHMDCRCNFP